LDRGEHAFGVGEPGFQTVHVRFDDRGHLGRILSGEDLPDVGQRHRYPTKLRDQTRVSELVAPIQPVTGC
jgi:hypothetical protein